MFRAILAEAGLILLGFSGGLAVGAGFVAFITVLGVIPRLIQLARAERHVRLYGGCATAGALFGTYMSFADHTWKAPVIFLAVWGGLHGIFNGMLAAALTEVLNVFPILSKRLRLDHFLIWLLMAVVFGKIAGSLFQWLVFVK